MVMSRTEFFQRECPLGFSKSGVAHEKLFPGETCLISREKHRLAESGTLREYVRIFCI